MSNQPDNSETLFYGGPCPKCGGEMRPTYEPYELRCWNCGYWFDTWTQKEVNPFPDEPTHPADDERIDQ